VALAAAEVAVVALVTVAILELVDGATTLELLELATATLEGVAEATKLLVVASTVELASTEVPATQLTYSAWQVYEVAATVDSLLAAW